MAKRIPATVKFKRLKNTSRKTPSETDEHIIDLLLHNKLFKNLVA